MRRFLNRLTLATTALATAALWLAGTGLVVMTAFVFLQVIHRYILGSSLYWAEPAAVMLMGWFIFLGAAVGVREGNHLAFDVGLMVMPPRMREWCYSISDLFVVAFGAGMVWFGWQLADRAWSGLVPGLGISRGWTFVPIMSGGALLVLFSIERVLRRAAGLKTHRFGDFEDEPETASQTKNKTDNRD